MFMLVLENLQFTIHFTSVDLPLPSNSISFHQKWKEWKLVVIVRDWIFLSSSLQCTCVQSQCVRVYGEVISHAYDLKVSRELLFPWGRSSFVGRAVCSVINRNVESNWILLPFGILFLLWHNDVHNKYHCWIGFKLHDIFKNRNRSLVNLVDKVEASTDSYG